MAGDERGIGDSGTSRRPSAALAIDRGEVIESCHCRTIVERTFVSNPRLQYVETYASASASSDE